MRSGSPPDPNGGRAGKGRFGRKSKRKWTPEPGSGHAPSWRDRDPRPPARFHTEAPPAPKPPTRQMPAPGTGSGPVPPPPPEEPPTSAFRGARPYPPGDPSTHRTQPVRREPPPPGSYYDDNSGYERYNTAGYPVGQQPPPPLPPPNGPPPPGPSAAGPPPEAGGVRMPKKITVTRVAALRGKQISGRAVDAFHRATKADGADKSGLTALTYAVMLNYASDATMMIALANTLFFSPTSADSSKGKIALFLLITIAPFGLVAPVIGPALDKIQRGRRLAMCISAAGQALMAVLMAVNFDNWVLYPAALGMMVLSKSFTVLKAAVTPRVVPPDITLSKTNARLTVFGLAAGGVFGALASGVNSLFSAEGALWFTALICVAGAVSAMRIPSWVEVTEGEVPASLSQKIHLPGKGKKKRQPMGRHVVLALWGNGTVRVLTGFLMMFAAFVVKEQTQNEPFIQLLLLGAIGGAAGVGGFLGNALGSRLHFGKPDQVIIAVLGAALASTVLAAILQGVATAAVVGLVGATASALAKISLDAVIQEDLPEESRASAFGRSETVLQLSWCFGGAVGLLLPSTFWIGFLVVSVLLAVGLAQTLLVRRGKTLLPFLGTDRPVHPPRTGNGNGGTGHGGPGYGGPGHGGVGGATRQAPPGGH